MSRYIKRLTVKSVLKTIESTRCRFGARDRQESSSNHFLYGSWKTRLACQHVPARVKSRPQTYEEDFTNDSGKAMFFISPFVLIFLYLFLWCNMLNLASFYKIILVIPIQILHFQVSHLQRVQQLTCFLYHLFGPTAIVWCSPVGPLTPEKDPLFLGWFPLLPVSCLRQKEQ